MIVKKSTPKKKYGDYFLAFEADGDEDQNQQQDVRSNMKQITVNTGNRRRVDFTDNADEPETSPEQPEEANTPDTETEEPPSEDTQTTDDQPDTNTEENPTEGENEPESGTDDNTDENEDDQPDTSGDDQNFNDGSDEDETSDNGTEQQNDNSEDQQNNQSTNGPGIEYDSMRQYKLFLDFKELANSVSNYISNLENEVRDDDTIMVVYKNVIDRFRKIENLLYDYMTLKYTASTYVQNLLFYKKIYTSVELLIETLLKTIQNNN